ncbi:hypothetical protein CRM22_001530 [Opisthorchis felineus]|uniref:TLDc domain-containing protein n=1 Tax=Opisthorchis felineus TaxID=147828 RepID=A0A4V3SGS1_OPIFE|nr:hypothetical protein CRM22_001530 [Opisthorchis felineus]
MGNIQSETETSKHGRSPKHHTGSSIQVSAPTNVDRSDFILKFDPHLASLADALWKGSFKSQVIPLREYESLVHKLNDRSDKLAYFVELAVGTDLNEKALQNFFCWLKFGRTFSDTLEKALFGTLTTSLLGLNSIEQIISRLRPMYQDVAEDLARLVFHTLTSSVPINVDFSISSRFSTLLSPGLLWVLSVVLSPPFKRPSETRFVNAAPLEIEQLHHLHQLYDSMSNGFSVTRIKELAFEYSGPLIVLLKTEGYLFCLASDQGLKDSMKTYGDTESKLFRIEPEFAKLVSGRSSKLAGPGVETGIIYSNFTAKTTRRGLLVGHQPLVAPALEINEGFTELRFTGSPPMKLIAVEIWAAGSPEKLTDLRAQKAWEFSQVNKEKNRKFKLEEDWRESTDRHILSMAGVNVNRSALLGATEEPPQNIPNK